MNPEKPFAYADYRLLRCRLRPVQSEVEAAVIGARLAGIDPWRRLNYPATDLSRYLVGSDPALRRYALDVSGDLAGVISVRYPWLRGPYLELLGIFPAYQGAGLGGEALGWFEQQAGLAAANAWVLVSAFNIKARAFYERHGFVTIGLIEALVKPGYDEILLRKVIKDFKKTP